MNAQCNAGDPTCAGPWSASTAQYDDWETQSPNGNGSFQEQVICADVASCTALGYTNTIADIEMEWIPNTTGAQPQIVIADYAPSCDPLDNSTFPNGCSPYIIAYQAKNAEAGMPCLGSPLTIGATPSGVDNFSDDVVQIYEVRGLGLGAHVGTVAGYVYQTGGGTYWFQLNATISGGAMIGASATTPYFSIGGITPIQLTSAVNTAISIMNLTTPPTQISKILAAGLMFGALPCFQNPWNGTYLSSVRRRP